MRLATLSVIAILTIASVAHAQRVPPPYEAFAGQTLNGEACEPNGGTRAMSICFALWRDQEDALLEQSVNRLIPYATEQQARSPIFSGESGYVASISVAQEAWLSWRNSECMLMTLDDVGGTIRNLSYPNCQANLSAQRRQKLDAVLEFWRAEFRDADGEARGVQCVLEPAAFHNCRR
ncbi:lysozyme inhibitor LprI family protein [Terricaulis sp.]|uniref:lysozyme inhibitor LprI family protein n=1 Tax=Terricaulis sp. TaxID=2768686 RepID=UPI003784A8AA